MKKYLIICLTIFLVVFGYYYLSYFTSFSLNNYKDAESIVRVDGKKILLNNEEFKIKAINIGSSLPGHETHSYPISYDTYIRWFKLISDMGINTVRVFTIQNPSFYEALRDYNKKSSLKLYLIQGIGVGDYEKNSSVDYFDSSLFDSLLEDCYVTVDVIHGKRIILYNERYASGSFLYDVSEYTLGYIIGTEWNDLTVSYTDHLNNDNSYSGKYISTTSSATPFERILAEVGDSLLSYETKVYKEQRLISFGTTPLTDPFDYENSITDYFDKIVKIDLNHLKISNKVKSGMFASFQVYSDYPDLLSYSLKSYDDTYYEYLKKINEYYSYPVIVSEFGYSTARVDTTVSLNNNYGTGVYDEVSQGENIVKAIKTMDKAGISGFILYEWCDEWDKNVWNSMHAVNTNNSMYWHNVETQNQNYGILEFESKNKNTIILDGERNDWNENDLITENNGTKLYSKYDESYVYFMIEKDNLDIDKDTFYIPIDTTGNSGSKTYRNAKLGFNRFSDFIIEINGKDSSRVVVQEYYNVLRAIYGKEVYDINQYEKKNVPLKNDDKFMDILKIQSFQTLSKEEDDYEVLYDANTIQTGKLVYGNGDKEASNYNSLSDFYFSSVIEIRIPWEMLNFYDPSDMMIHDDYYKNYGVEDIHIDKMYMGVGTYNEYITLREMPLEGWHHKVDYQERLKKSYYIIQKYLKENGK